MVPLAWIGAGFGWLFLGLGWAVLFRSLRLRYTPVRRPRLPAAQLELPLPGAVGARPLPSNTPLRRRSFVPVAFQP